jgi:hypothetical protein
MVLLGDITKGSAKVFPNPESAAYAADISERAAKVGKENIFMVKRMLGE